MFWLRVSAKFSVSLSMSTMMEVSQTLWRLVFLPRKVTFLLLPPRSLLSSQWRGWCRSPTKWTTNFKASLRSVSLAVVSFNTATYLVTASVTQLPPAQSRVATMLFSARGMSMKCRGLVAGRTLRTESAQLAIDSRETPGPRIAWALARAVGVRWRSAMLATTAWPSTPQPKAGLAKTREMTITRAMGLNHSLRFIGTHPLDAMYIRTKVNRIRELSVSLYFTRYVNVQ